MCVSGVHLIVRTRTIKWKFSINFEKIIFFNEFSISKFLIFWWHHWHHMCFFHNSGHMACLCHKKLTRSNYQTVHWPALEQLINNYQLHNTERERERECLFPKNGGCITLIANRVNKIHIHFTKDQWRRRVRIKLIDTFQGLTIDMYTCITVEGRRRRNWRRETETVLETFLLTDVSGVFHPLNSVKRFLKQESVKRSARSAFHRHVIVTKIEKLFHKRKALIGSQ